MIFFSFKKAIVDKQSAFHQSISNSKRFETFGFIRFIKIAYSSSLNNNDYKISNLNNKNILKEDHQKDNTEWFNMNMPLLDLDDSIRIRLLMHF
jgi:hypothetical protein